MGRVGRDCGPGGGGATPTIVRFIAAGTGGLVIGGGGAGSPTPTIVAFIPRGGPRGGGAAGPPAGAAAGFVTRKECPHFGHRIFSPVGGTRRSSIGYAALHDSHSTFSIRERAYHRACFGQDVGRTERGAA
jgi:hypothetical protein